MSAKVSFQADETLRLRLQETSGWTLPALCFKEGRDHYAEALKLQIQSLIGTTRGHKDEFPSTLKLGKAANASYSPKSSKNPKLGGWAFLCSAKSETNGYYGLAFLCIKSSDPIRVIITHRGTKPGVKVLEADVNGILLNQFTSQLNSACTFVILISEAMKLLRHYAINIQLSITGHSLGGWLAQVTTFAAEHLTFDESNEEGVAPKFVLSRDGVHAHCECFDAPGAKQMLQKIIKEMPGCPTNVIEKLDITVFQGPPNIINTVNEHVGILIYLPLAESEEYMKNAAATIQAVPLGIANLWLLGLSAGIHSMNNFEKLLEGEGGRNYHRILSWPLCLLQHWTNENSAVETGNRRAFFKCAGAALRFGYQSSDILKELTNYLTNNPNNVVPYDHKLVSLNVFSAQEKETLGEMFVWKRHFSESIIPTEEENLIQIVKLLDSLSLETREVILSEGGRDLEFIRLVKKLARMKGKGRWELPRFPEIFLQCQSYQYETDLYEKFMKVERDSAEYNPHVAKKLSELTGKCELKFSCETGGEDFVRFNFLQEIYDASQHQLRPLFIKVENLAQLESHYKSLRRIPGIGSEFTIVLDFLTAVDSKMKLKSFPTINSMIGQHKRILVHKYTEVSLYKPKFVTNLIDKSVILSATRNALGNVLPGIEVDFNFFLQKNMTNLFSYLSKNATAAFQSRRKPKRFFEDMTNYLVINEELKVNQLLELSKEDHFLLYGNTAECFRLKETLEENGFGKVEVFSAEEENESTQVLSSFQKYSNENEDHYVDLFRCISEKEVIWMYQYNPELF